MTTGAEMERLAREAAATEIGRLATLIVTELAPVAGLYVGIKIEPANAILKDQP